MSKPFSHAAVSDRIRDTTFYVTQEDSQTYYDSWVPTYEKDMVTTLGWHVPETCVDLLNKHGNIDENTVLLDCGAGTGLFSYHLRKSGFKGTIDMLDANYEMLAEARKKKFEYRNLFVHLIGEDGHLPLKDESYDVFNCTGTFIPAHVPPKAFRGLINVVKKGGLVVYNIRNTEREMEYFNEFTAMAKKLEEQKVIEAIDMKRIYHFQGPDISGMYSNCYICRKLV